MIIVKLQGGLGNQMFQYALARSLAERNNDRFILDAALLLDRTPREGFVYRNYDLGIFRLKAEFTLLSKLAFIFPIPVFYVGLSTVLSRFKKSIGMQKYVKENKPGFVPEILDEKGNIYLDGYWQSEKYFKNAEQAIRRDFSFLNEFPPEIRILADEIKKENSICLNVRRGDYVTVESSIKTHGFIGTDYYSKGIDLIASKIQNPHFYVFSDEIEWCMDNLKINYPHTFVTHNYAGEKFEYYLHLMSLCKHFLIPNSTFAWWAAWLASHENKMVFVPKEWFKDQSFDSSDIIPANWVRI
jgi:hypothetical protein